MLLTNDSVKRAISREKSSTFIQDSQLPFLRCRITPKSATFYAFATIQGQRVRKRIGRFPFVSPEQARSACWNLVNQTNSIPTIIAKQPSVTVKSITYGELLSLYAVNKRMKESTRISYEGFLRNSQLIDAQIHDVTPKAFLDKFNVMYAIYPTKAKKVAAIVKSLTRWYASYQNETIDDPTKLISTVAGVGIHSTNCRTRRLTAETLPTFWRVLAKRSELERDVITFCLLTAMRRNEVLSLTKDNITVMDGHFTVTLPTTKNGKPHSLPLVGIALEIIKRRMIESPDRLFPTQAKHAFTALKSAGVDLSWHDLRRSWASFAVSHGVSDSLVKRALNHSAEGVTARHYAHFDDAAVANALVLVESKVICDAEYNVAVKNPVARS